MCNNSEEIVDRLSGLPDNIIGEILSFLPLKTAASTATLSRRWRWLWAQFPNIELSFESEVIKKKGFVELSSVVDSFLHRFSLLPLSIRRFSLHLGWVFLFVYDEKESISCFLLSWFDWAFKQQSVQELSFKMDKHSPKYPDIFPDTPLMVFQIPSLVVLELKPCVFLHRDYHLGTAVFHLPNLRKLSVELLCCDAQLLDKLVSSSPSLDYLFFEVYFESSSSIPIHNQHTVNISSPTLKHLDMHLIYPMFVTLNTPNLDYLNVHVYDSWITLPYRISFVNSPPSLLASSILDWIDLESIDDVFLPSNFFSVISNVTSLTLIDKVPSPLMAAVTFRRLAHLKLRVYCPLSGLALLQQCPVLEVLTLELTHSFSLWNSTWSVPDFTPQCLVTSVKRIEILVDMFYDELENYLLHLLKCLLGTAKALELLRINIARPEKHQYKKGRYPELDFIKELFEAPTSSAHCRIEFYGLHHRVLVGGIDSDPSMGST